MKLAVIGGTGFGKPDILGETSPLSVETPFGEVALNELQLGDRTVYLLSRHMADHTVAPHLVNYRANMMALKQLGVTRVIATAAVGAISELYEVGDMMMLSQFLDFTKQRPLSVLDQTSRPIHIDLTNPYCHRLSSLVAREASEVGVSLKRDAIYACMEGPRFETAAEIQMLRRLGADVVGMTQVPEVVMARELEFCYAAVGLVTNLAAGRRPGEVLSHASIDQVLSEQREALSSVIRAALLAEEELVCECQYALFEYR